MNKLSIALNLVLFAAVGYLYYYNFSAKKSAGTTTVEGTQKIADSCSNIHRIAYVDLDSLNENIVYFKQQRKVMDQEQKQIEEKIADDIKTLEASPTLFAQKHPNATPEESQNFRAQYAQQQQEIENEKQKESQDLNQRHYALVAQIQKNLKSFLEEYNKNKKYLYILTTGGGMDYMIYKDSTLDITSDVIKGMNEMKY
jgi:outer membrane protein